MTYDPSHHIDRHILKVLTYHESVRYRDMRPKNTDSNLFNYHRKTLLQQRYIKKNTDNTYSMAARGYRLIDRVSYNELRMRDRPKLSVLFLLNNANGEVAVWKKVIQPFIGMTNLPNGKMHFDDESVVAAAERMLSELTSEKGTEISLRGCAEVSIKQADELFLHNVYMVASADIDDPNLLSDLIFWLEPGEVKKSNAAPGVSEIIQDFLHTKQQLFKSYHFSV